MTVGIDSGGRDCLETTNSLVRLGYTTHSSKLVDGWRDQALLGGTEPMARLFQALTTLREIAAELIAERRVHPKDDLLNALVAAEVDGEQLTFDEIVSFFTLLMVAGNDTTRQSTSHGLKALSDFPDQRAWLMEDLPARMPSATEEIVRWATPIMTFRRTAAHDTVLAGQHITAGDKVIMFYSAANWDSDVFDRPERFDLSRSPNNHVSFGGGGIHHCLGNQLARKQLSATFRELLTQLPDIRVVGEPVFGTGNFFHTVKSMTAQYTPRR